MNKISFIIPVFDVDTNDLIQCINSITSQKLLEYEILIINDGSKSKEIDRTCKKMADSNKNIKYYYQNNSGSAVARNTGLNNSSGDYIMFIDADDMLVNDVVEKIYAVTRRVNKFDIIIFDYSYWDLSNENIQSLQIPNNYTDKKKDIMSNILYYPNKVNDFMFGSIWAKLFSKKFLENNGILFEPELRKAQDRRFMMDVVYHSNTILYYPIYTYKYRTNNNSICHRMNYNMIDYYKKLYISLVNFKNKYNLDDDVYKFLEYNIINELLPLSVFHIDNKKKFCEKNVEFKKLYSDYNLYYKTRKIKLHDIPSFRGKVKLLLFRYKLTFMIYLFYINKQKKIIRKSFN